MSKTFTIKIAGPAGIGVKKVGRLLCRCLTHSGYFTFGYPEYPSLIRGGHNSYQITIRSDNLLLNSNQIDLLIPLTQTALDLEKLSTSSQTIVAADQQIKVNHYQRYQTNLQTIIKDVGSPLILNTLILSFLTNKLKLDPNFALNQLTASLSGKPLSVIKANKQAFKQGLSLAKDFPFKLSLPQPKKSHHYSCLTGNEAAGIGALAAGIDLYTAYPMTPSSSLFHFLISHQDHYPHQVFQPEDEIAAINLALGASFAGAKAMTGTSGGGFALMQESISLAGITELPLVVYLAMRPGPATGMSTWTSQSDLLFAINSGQGEFPKIVLAPSNPYESLLLTHQAFSLSQKFHLPVIILSDKYLSESCSTTKTPPLLKPVPVPLASPQNNPHPFYPRYQMTKTGVHPRPIPGLKNGLYNANSSEHDVYGLSDNSIPNRTFQNQRRLNRLAAIKKTIPLPSRPKKLTSTALISWGSHRDIAATISHQIPALTHLHFNYLWPLPNKLAQLLSQFKRVIVLENNLTHQFAKVLAQETGIQADQCLGKDTGRPLNPEEYIKEIKI